MRFSVITPSFRNSSWLRQCIASVADQGVEVEHIIQDACSDDGTQDWLPHDKRVKAFIEKDAGMYDAINRGLRRAEGDILSYLNCDEQYLPGALKAVEQFFTGHPKVDVVFGDFVAVNEKGNYLFHRKVLTPQLYHTWVAHLQAFTCGTFFRRSVISERGLFFDPKFRMGGDAEWMLRLLKQHVPMAVLRQYTSTFGMTGTNLSSSEGATREANALAASAPAWARRSRWLLVLQHRLRRLLGGIYFQRPFAYAIYAPEQLTQRVTHHVTQPDFRWRT